MTQPQAIETLEALKHLGFAPDASALSYGGEALSYDFGNLTLSARQTMNRYFAEIISVSGVYATPRTIAEVEIQLPLRVASVQQCAAFIAWGIDKQVSRNFVPLAPTRWLDEGRNNFDLLPWIRKQKRLLEEQKLYNERPRCTVERDWIKLALRDLRSLLPQLDKSESLSFTYRDEIFSIRTRLKLFALPATGNSWKSSYEITAGNFQNFPKRFKYNEVEISIWEEHLHLANWRYPIEKTTDGEALSASKL